MSVRRPPYSIYPRRHARFSESWADATWFHGDPAFVTLRESDEVKQIGAAGWGSEEIHGAACLIACGQGPRCAHLLHVRSSAAMRRGNCWAIAITHGTNTLEETAYFPQPHREVGSARGVGGSDAANSTSQRHTLPGDSMRSAKRAALFQLLPGIAFVAAGIFSSRFQLAFFAVAILFFAVAIMMLRRSR
jgi:hypothetical protein